MLDLAAIGRSRIHRDPFSWMHATGLFDVRDGRALRDAFPAAGMADTRRLTGPGKRYRMASRTLFADGAEHPVDDLDPRWRALLAELLEPAYRDALSELTGVDVTRCAREVRACRYEPSCWLDPHTDRPEKKLTQVLYFNEPWEPAWGGALRILRSSDADDVAYEAAPVLGTAVVLVRSERSWHAVAPVAPGVERARMSLLVHLTAPDG